MRRLVCGRIASSFARVSDGLANRATDRGTQSHSLARCNQSLGLTILHRCFRSRVHLLCCAVLALTMLPFTVLAEVNTLARFRMGEADGGISGNTVTNEADSSGNGFHLDVVTGNQVWSSDTPSTAGSTLPLGVSSLSVRFTAPASSYRNAGGQTNSQVTALSDNVGIEAWVKSDDLHFSAIIVHNGRSMLPPLSGFGLVQLAPGTFGNTNTVYAGQVAGAFVGSATASTNEWTHLALVRDSAAFGGWRFFVNGTLNGTNSAPGIAASGTFEMGAGTAVPGGALPFNGKLDEVRVFSFSSGQFSTNDLNVTPP